MKPFEKPIKILVIGNSITKHAVAEAKGWMGDWGMAATGPEKDYVHRLLAKAQDVNSAVKMKWVNISEFEKYFYDFSKVTQNYDEYVDFDADIIICTIGANVKNPEPEGDSEFETEIKFSKEYYKAIVDHFNFGNRAKIIAGTTIFTSEGGEVQKAIVAAAEAYGYDYVKMNDLTANEYSARPYEAILKEKFGVNEIISGVLSHPGDEGMRVMAERLWIKLEPVMKTFK